MKDENFCNLCPRQCKIDRNTQCGYCGVKSNIKVSKAFLHKWEEPCISGTKGSGTIFFSGCNLKCVYCQNYKISQEGFGKEITIEEFCNILYKLRDNGAHNINLVTPTHYIHKIIECKQTLRELGIPIVYNTNGYESAESLKLLDGIIDVYLPDIKYIDSETSKRYSQAENYFMAASEAVLEMYRQVGKPVFDENGLITKGVIVRHLVLPGHIKESIKILHWINENLPQDITVSVMSQYIPYYKAECFPEINRRITKREYEKVTDYFFGLGFENGYIQERSSAEDEYIPDFNLEGL